jgi:cell division transport system permease protein
VFRHRTDFALERDGLNRFLPWLIAFMVFLAVFAFAGVLALGAAAERWDKGIGGTLTVQILPSAAGDGRTEAKEAEAVQRAVGVLRATPGVTRAQPIDEASLLRLLEPWLGPLGAPAELPLPRLIDVEIAGGAAVDVAELSRRLAAAVPGASVDDHRVWLGRLIRLIRAVEAVAVAVLALILLATAGTVVFTTRTGLAVHREAIEVLHLIGAQDSYVARQFAVRAFALGLTGGLIGLGLALPTLAVLVLLARLLGWDALAGMAPHPLLWLAIPLLPATVAAVAMLTARVTVLRTLAKLL